MATALCPHCGYDLEHDDVIVSGALEIDPRGSAIWHGERLKISPAQHQVLYALAKSAGRPLNRSAIAERLGYEGDRPDNLVMVHISRLRAVIGHDAIETVHARGWRLTP